jgi:1,4-alpha-glucan branching enzyme
MGWMHDTLVYVSKDPIYRQWHHNQLTFSLAYAWSENFTLPISHDEVVHGKGSLASKMPGDRWQRLATVRALLAYMWAHPGKQLLFMGSELADDQEWSEERGLNWGLLDDPARAGVQSAVRDLNAAYRDAPALWERDTSPDGFRWLDADDAAHNLVAFVRYANDGSPLVCVVNFAANPHEGYRLGLPSTGRWREVVNTDASAYGGSNVGNLGSIVGDSTPWQGMPASAVIRVPPLAGVWFRPES